ncbi:hypothetical protein L593_06200 [Salinarchaeum sp. Harcht-Bsk1]|uniref:hypothetical protein n=1 Tax=Salinarchaeum sp. Harcht-Bsk1 TaxID=1333523 RepID=UPI0003423715|nr:hypothetical protein [Salinarchaeum sp. Harcht-Bsk1]AGN01189.1 hypothetical protein L593_06200 [Salinarchaeum sp. Harcht-Bsk1]
MVTYGVVAVILPQIPAMIGRLGYALLTPGESISPEYPEIWLARVLGVVSLAFGTLTLYEVLG